jgi:hypothetical protein
MRFRTLFIAGGSVAVMAALFATDPDRGISTGMLLLALVTPVLAVAFAHLARKALMDYPEADMQSLFRRAGESPTGAGLALVALALIVSALLALFGRGAHAAQPPHPRAVAMADLLRSEIARWPELPVRAYVPALIEHESCISLTHSRCWSPTSRLKTSREEGAGLGQLTRAWNADGSLRFDALGDLRARHPDLRELSWATIYTRPDLQVRALVVMSRANWQALAQVQAPMERLAMSDAAYNGGLGGVQRERRACQMTAGCDPQRWWGHVEARCLKSRAALYAGRSACDINRHHVADVLRARLPKYVGLV